MDAFFAAGGGDVIQQLTARISTSTICDLLGFERADHVQLKKWVDGLIYRDPVTRQLPPSGHEARRAMVDYAQKTIETRRLEPRDDLISALIAAEVEGHKLSAVDLMHTIATLLGAGIESASSFIGNAMLALNEHPDQSDLLASDLSKTPSRSRKCCATTRRHSAFIERRRKTSNSTARRSRRPERSGDVRLGEPRRAQVPDPDRFDITANAGQASRHGSRRPLLPRRATRQSDVAHLPRRVVRANPPLHHRARQGGAHAFAGVPRAELHARASARSIAVVHVS
jgi:hypothetical protein